MMKFLVTYNQSLDEEYFAYDYSYEKDKLFLRDKDESIAAIIMLANVNSVQIRTV